MSTTYEPFGLEALDRLEQIAEISREYGADPEYVLADGGNTSCKTEDTLYVKPSGAPLATLRPEEFVALDRERLRGMLAADYSSDPLRREEEVKRDLLAARREPERGERPSAEAVLHGLLDRKFVVHLHPCEVNGLLCAQNGEELARQMWGDTILWIPYTGPGYLLSSTVAEQLAAFPGAQGREPLCLLLQNHGIFLAAETTEEIRSGLRQIMAKLEEYFATHGAAPTFPPPAEGTKVAPEEPDRDYLLALAPALRGALAANGLGPIVRWSSDSTIRSLLATPRGEEQALSGPITPDMIVCCKSLPLWLSPEPEEAPETLSDRLAGAARAYVETHGYGPRVVLLPGVGAWTVGSSPKDARTAEEIYADALRSIALSEALGGPRFLNQREQDFIETWEVEEHRRKVLSGGESVSVGPVAGRVAVVTGAAQGIGKKLAEGLAAAGAYVMVADINEAGAEIVAHELCEQWGEVCAKACRTNVTDGASVAKLAEAVTREFGGCDAFISNAGVLRAGSVKTLPDDDFAFVTDVNYRGYFHSVKYIAPVLAAQHRANPKYWTDIIQINSKSGLVGSNKNAAYAGSKFGGLGLTQSFALELAEDGIKVNAVCPGNFFDGPLWSDLEKGLFVQYLRAGKVPGAKTIEDVRRFYESKIPMGRGCEIEDLLHAVFYLIEQRYETGQALPVTGGQVMLS